MQSHFNFSVAIVAAPVLAALLGTGLAMAQAGQEAPSQAAQLGAAPFVIDYEGHVIVREDRTATDTFTYRIKILTQGAIAAVSHQQLTFIEGMETLDTVEAFTEKADGSKVPVLPANIITGDAASGRPAIYLRDLKRRTILFQDVQVGDTLVMTHIKETRQSLFPGQFFYSDVFARSQPIASAHIVVEAPRDVDLQVRTIGKGLTQKVEDIDDIRRHTVTLQPQPYLPEEAGAVAAVDRDPALLVSTFKSYDEMGLAYAAAAFPKAAITPEIAALANDITKGIEDRRQQAIAIDAWMKKNIRYEAVFLSLGRVIPNDAATVLRNKFGDCKDKATLTSALLAAKGIASEAVLISFGNAYTLPEPPAKVVLNHVILYLPEFDLYDDPTQQFAAFGVLAAETYDKPVVRARASGATLARTPAMRPEDHTIQVRTIVNVAAGGAVTGQTEESATGVFGSALRSAGALIQILGSEIAAQRLLQTLNTPGTGRTDVGNSAETTDPVTLKSWFTLNQRFEIPTTGGAPISFGLPHAARPGGFLLGTRIDGRKSPFICYAGRQTEDIEATFDPSLPMPVPLVARTIDNPAFTYRATFKIEGRTLKTHREFVSRVAGQVCPPELEAQIASDMNTVRINVNSAYTFAAAQNVVRNNTNSIIGLPTAQNTVRNYTNSTDRLSAAQHTYEFARAVAFGQKLRLDFLFDLYPDCSSMGFATVRIIEQPKHGRMTVERGTGFSRFRQDNIRYECNKRRSEGVNVNYKADPGFAGMDAATIDVILPDGTSNKRHYAIEVK